MLGDGIVQSSGCCTARVCALHIVLFFFTEQRRHVYAITAGTGISVQTPSRCLVENCHCPMSEREKVHSMKCFSLVANKQCLKIFSIARPSSRRVSKLDGSCLSSFVLFFGLCRIWTTSATSASQSASVTSREVKGPGQRRVKIFNSALLGHTPSPHLHKIYPLALQKRTFSFLIAATFPRCSANTFKDGDKRFLSHLSTLIRSLFVFLWACLLAQVFEQDRCSFRVSQTSWSSQKFT